jgi:hypothetical protein
MKSRRLRSSTTDSIEEKSVVSEVADAVKGTAQRIGEAVDSGHRPGMPLSVLSNIAREAPLDHSRSHSCWVSLSQGEDSSQRQGGGTLAKRSRYLTLECGDP